MGGFKNQTTNEKKWFLSHSMHSMPTSKLKQAWGVCVSLFIRLFPPGRGGAEVPASPSHLLPTLTVEPWLTFTHSLPLVNLHVLIRMTLFLKGSVA